MALINFKSQPGKVYVKEVRHEMRDMGCYDVGPLSYMRAGPIEVTAVVQPPFDVMPLVASGKPWLLVPDDPEVCARPDGVRAARDRLWMTALADVLGTVEVEKVLTLFNSIAGAAL